MGYVKVIPTDPNLLPKLPTGHPVGEFSHGFISGNLEGWWNMKKFTQESPWMKVNIISKRATHWKPNMTMENQPWMMMYLLLKNRWFSEGGTFFWLLTNFLHKVCKDGKAWGHRHTDHLPTAGSLERGIIFGWLGDLGRDMVDKVAVATARLPWKEDKEAEHVLKSRTPSSFESF